MCIHAERTCTHFERGVVADTGVQRRLVRERLASVAWYSRSLCHNVTRTGSFTTLVSVSTCNVTVCVHSSTDKRSPRSNYCIVIVCTERELLSQVHHHTGRRYVWMGSTGGCQAEASPSRSVFVPVDD